MIRNETMKFIIELENKNGRNFINRNIEIILQCIIHDLIVSLIESTFLRNYTKYK